MLHTPCPVVFFFVRVCAVPYVVFLFGLGGVGLQRKVFRILLACDDGESNSMKVYRIRGQSSAFSVPLTLPHTLVAYSTAGLAVPRNIPGNEQLLYERHKSHRSAAEQRRTSLPHATVYRLSVRYICFKLDAPACRRDITNYFHAHAVCLSGAWGPTPEDVRM